MGVLKGYWLAITSNQPTGFNTSKPILSCAGDANESASGAFLPGSITESERFVHNAKAPAGCGEANGSWTESAHAVMSRAGTRFCSVYPASSAARYFAPWRLCARSVTSTATVLTRLPPARSSPHPLACRCRPAAHNPRPVPRPVRGRRRNCNRR